MFKPPEPEKLGKIVSLHGITAAFLQRTVIVAAMSFVFFMVTMVMFSMWRNFLYFFLSTAFLIVYLFTMFGWLMLRKYVLRVYENGISYRKFEARWNEIASVATSTKNGRVVCEITTKKGARTTLTDSLVDVEKAIAIIESMAGKPSA